MTGKSSPREVLRFHQSFQAHPQGSNTTQMGHQHCRRALCKASAPWILQQRAAQSAQLLPEPQSARRQAVSRTTLQRSRRQPPRRCALCMDSGHTGWLAAPPSPALLCRVHSRTLRHRQAQLGRACEALRTGICSKRLRCRCRSNGIESAHRLVGLYLQLMRKRCCVRTALRALQQLPLDRRTALQRGAAMKRTKPEGQELRGARQVRARRLQGNPLQQLMYRPVKPLRLLSALLP